MIIFETKLLFNVRTVITSKEIAKFVKINQHVHYVRKIIFETKLLFHVKTVITSNQIAKFV